MSVVKGTGFNSHESAEKVMSVVRTDRKRKEEAMENTVLKKVNTHVGATLLKLAREYPTLIETIGEQVQNAVDCRAKRIDLHYDVRERWYTISDDGIGATECYFDESLQTIGQGRKAKDQMGQFGIGLISPLGKCKEFSFVSCPEGEEDKYNEWILRTQEICSCGHGLGIPMKRREDLVHNSCRKKIRGKNKSKVWWRTQVIVRDVIEDRLSTSLSVETLAQSIRGKSSAAMRRRDTKVNITIIDGEGKMRKTTVTPKEFSGTPLEEFSHETEEGGKTVVKFFLAKDQRRPKRRVNIKFGVLNDDYRFAFAPFATSYAAKNLLSEDVMDAFRSGIFEGEILCERAQLRESRRSFYPDDSIIGMCISLEEWYKRVGKDLLHEQQKKKKDDRYQRTARKSLGLLEEMIRNGEAPDFKEVIEGFGWGTIGKGHTPKKGKKQGSTSVSVQGSQKKPRGGNKKGPKEKGGENKSGEVHDTRGENEEHVPVTVVGPNGQKRKAVKNNSLGLQMVHEKMFTENLWHLEIESGILTINTSHPSWGVCKDSTDAKLVEFQRQLVSHALLLEKSPKEYKAHIRQFSEMTLENYANMLAYPRTTKKK